MALLQLKKRLMAVAGLVLTAYLVLHMMTNLSFIDPASYEAFYAFYNQPLIRWPLWLLFTAAVLVHVIVAIQIRLVNGRARQVAYRHRQHHWIPAWLVNIVISLILLFIIWHMAQMQAFGHGAVYAQTLALFSSGWQVLVYLAGLLLLATHLLHSLTNVLQTLGITSRQFAGVCIAGVLILMVGFALVPVLAYWRAA